MRTSSGSPRKIGSRLARLAALTTALLFAPTPPGAWGQYLYIDTDGDGVHTAADVLSPTGTTDLDVWLVTNADRDGSSAACPTGEALTINSYEFILKAVNGFITWGTFTNRQPDMALAYGVESSATEYHNGFAGGPGLPPGAYRLATLEVSVALGTPSIEFASASSLSGADLTSFGSQCPGQDFDNTLKLGSDWFDADGVEYGGTPQSPPVLAPIADMTVSEGSVVEQTISATDADLEPLQFQKVSGPAYMSVTTVDPGLGVATGAIRLEPGLKDAGTATGTVRVTDGIVPDERSFGISVLNVDQAPVVVTQPQVTVSTGSHLAVAVSVADADGDPIEARIASSPSYVPNYPYLPTATGIGGASFSYSVDPTSQDVGSDYVVIEASDGTNVGHGRTQVDVSGPAPAPRVPSDLFTSVWTAEELSCAPSGVAVGDLDGDGDADVVIASTLAGLVEIHRSEGRGEFSLIGRIDGLDPERVAVADLDRDGIAELAIADGSSGDLVIYHAPFTGATSVAQRLHVGTRPVGIAFGDLNQDGWTDIVVVDRAEAKVSIFRNDGAGKFLAAVAYAVAPDPIGAAIGDYVVDGWPDVVVVSRSPAELRLFQNDGSGTLVPAGGRPLTGMSPVDVVPFDYQKNGRMDLGVADENSGVAIVTSDGSGGFFTGSWVFGKASAVAVGDLDGDGVGDLVGAGRGVESPYEAHRTVSTLPARGGALDTAIQGGGDPIAGLAVGDVDGDGNRDVLAVATWYSQGVLTLYRGRGDGGLGTAWRSPAPIQQGNPTLGDFNGDGHLDVASSRDMFLGRGDGTFDPPFQSGMPGYFIGQDIAADLNGDGRLDLIQMEDCCYTVEIGLGDGSGHFTRLSEMRTVVDQHRHVAVGDLDEDGVPDLIVSPGLEWYRGVGDGTFEPVRIVAGTSDLIGSLLFDQNGDGHLDFAFAWPYVGVAHGRGDGTFDPPLRLVDGYGSYNLGFGDLNEDGRGDIVATQGVSGYPDRLSLSNANGGFDAPRTFWRNSNWTPRIRERIDGFPVFDADDDGHRDVLGWYGFGIALGKGDGQGGISKRRLFGPMTGMPLLGDVNEDGLTDIVMAGGDYFFYSNPLIVFLNQSNVVNRHAARAFLSGDAKTIPIGATGRDLCFRVEPVAGSYANTDVDIATFVMKSEGTGSVGQIPASPSKRVVDGDTDRNGVPEISACFASTDLARLFSLVQGRRTVPVVLEARLASGGRLHADVMLTLVSAGAVSGPSLAPNPINPVGVFRFTTSRDGAARIAMFDVRGRFVRDILDRVVPAGAHEIVFDGRDRDGRRLASGIYFARIETVDGSYRLRVAVLK